MNRESQILNYIKNEIETKNHVPSIREICNTFEIVPVPNIKQYLNKLFQY